MNISYNWLKEYLDFNLTPEEVGDILTNVGLEVEAIQKSESVKGGLEGLKIGLVMSVEKHPDADKLTITKVTLGDPADLQIICGAPNVAAGQKVIVATDGTTIHPYQGEPFKIKKTKIRGVFSEGMICAEDEIGLSDDHGGIMILPADAQAGTWAKDFLKVETDYILEIGITPNRPDAMSHIGIARDLAAYLISNKNATAPLHIPDISAFKADNHSLPIEVSVENTEACPRFSGVSITGITVKESPEWLKNKLKAVGLRPINNIVDITNFVMYECGQPLHAYDADEVTGKKIIVKTLPAGTIFRTLDEKEIKLRDKDLIVCNAEEGMCIAGVYGGIKSGVKDSTKNIFLEAAYWNPKWIRRTATYHQLRTDAASHFEKGTDPNGNTYALKRAAMLMRESGGGKISSEIVDVYPEPVKEKVISLSFEKLTSYAGIEISVTDVKKILSALEFKIISADEKRITVSTPTFKSDVSRDVDVIEEVMRIYGIDKIPVPDAVRSSISYSLSKKDKEVFTHQLAEMLSGSGFHEMMNNSISNSKYHETFFPETKDSIVRLASYSNIGLDSMRTSLVFPALEVVRYNHNHKIFDLKLFEFGKTYRKENDQYMERSHLILIVTGNKFNESWKEKEQPAGFYFLKGIIENILRKAGIHRFIASPEANVILQQGLTYQLGKQGIATIGKVNDALLSYFEIKKDVYYAEFDAEALLSFSKNTITYKASAKFPAVRRDIALVINKKISFGEIEQLALNSSGKLLKEVNLFDVYEDEKFGADKKSYAVSFIFQDENKTLTDEEVDNAVDKLIQQFSLQLNASIRN